MRAARSRGGEFNLAAEASRAIGAVLEARDKLTAGACDEATFGVLYLIALLAARYPDGDH